MHIWYVSARSQRSIFHDWFLMNKKFNNNFSSVAQVLNESIPYLPDDTTASVKIIRKSFVVSDTDAEEFYNIFLPFITKSAPLDEVPTVSIEKLLA